MDELSRLTTKDVLREGAEEEHERLKTALWDHLVRLENNVALLEDLVSFPGLTFLRGERRVLDWMGQNLYEYTIIVAWRLWADNDPKSVTLKRLRRFLWDNAREEYKQALQRRLKALKPEKSVRDVLARAQAVRHGRLAHIDEAYRFDEARRVAGVGVPELRRCADFLGQYFNGLQFGIGSYFGLATFEKRDDRPSVTEQLLERLVLTGFYVKRYEKYGPEIWWRGIGARLSEEESVWLSNLRERHGLAPLTPKPEKR